MFNWLRKPKPPVQPHILQLRDALFADEPFEAITQYDKDASPDSPWALFRSAYQRVQMGDKSAAAVELKKILEQPALETRVHLQTWHLLRGIGEFPPENQQRTLQGMVLEVHLDRGLDILAAYADHTARYYNHSGAGIIWETPGLDKGIDQLIDQWFVVGQWIVNNTGPWDQPRPPAPEKGGVRINLLTFGGYYFGQGEFTVLAEDQMGGAAIQAGYNLLVALMNFQESRSRTTSKA